LERARLLQALQKHPILRDLFGKEWFLRKLSEKERHVLIELLLEEEPEVEHVKVLFNDLQASLKAGRIKDFISIDSEISKLLYFSKFLKNLEGCLEKLKEVKGFNGIVEKLRESDDFIEFFYTADKIEIASSFFEYFDGIEIETNDKQCKTSFKVKRKDRIIHFNFISSDTVNDFVKRVAFRENSHLVPVVGISDLGTLRKVKTKNLYDIEGLSGFVIYNRVVFYGTSILTGFFMENPKARNKLSEDEVSILCRSLHLIRFPVTELIQVFSNKSIERKLKKGGFYTTQSFLQEVFSKHLADWIKSPEDVSLLLLLFMVFLSRQSDKYEYQCYTRSFVLHLSALTVNAENWWRALMRLGGSLSFLQDGIAQIQNLETILLSKRKASEEIKISLLLPLYTSTLEGIFQRMVRIIATEINIITGKSSKNVSEIGIPKLVQKIDSFNEGELRILTKGYNQTLRNAYSHGTYNIDLDERRIIARDRTKEEIVTFSQLKKMRKRLEQASYMVAFSLVAILFRLALEQAKRENNE
jgi:hypothetical protein